MMAHGPSLMEERAGIGRRFSCPKSTTLQYMFRIAGLHVKYRFCITTCV